jgi:hypothetical protein
LLPRRHDHQGERATLSVRREHLRQPGSL